MSELYKRYKSYFAAKNGFFLMINTIHVIIKRSRLANHTRSKRTIENVLNLGA